MPRRELELLRRVRTPLAGGHHRVAVLSLKGGVGKTTITAVLGLTLASLRDDRVIALDANPGRGTLADRLRPETAATVRDLLNESGRVRRYADMRAYTTQAAGSLEVLASDPGPAVSVPLSAGEYQEAARVIERHYPVCLTDCGTGLLHPSMAAVLSLADQIILVSTPSLDGARSASATLDWLRAHHHGGLARDAVVALCMVRRGRWATASGLARLEQHFAGECRSVVRIPYDPHLGAGSEVSPVALRRATARAFLGLAAEVAGRFAGSSRPPGA